MTSTTIAAAGPGLVAEETAGPLEQRHLQYANYRAVADGSRVTRTHWHIALANGLGWGFDGMDGVIFGLISPLVIKEFALSIPTYRTGFQIWLTLGITGLYFWPWLSDRVGRRSLLAVNIAMFSLMMPAVALSPSFAVFVGARALLTFATNGEWSLGSMLVAETWPAHLRGRVISINRATWCFGASFAGAITGLVADTLAAGGILSAEDRSWYTKADKVGIRQVFMPDVLPATLVATFVTCCSCCIYGTVGAWMPLYLSTEKHWSTAEYSTFYVFWGLVGFLGLCAAGWLADKIGRRVGFIALLIWGAVFMTLWVYAPSNLWLWIFGLAWSFGFLGFWGPSTTLTAEVFPTRIRGVANGVVWFIGFFVGFVLWPFATVYLQQRTGSFDLAFLCIPILMIAMAIGVWLWVPEHSGKELNAIAT